MARAALLLMTPLGASAMEVNALSAVQLLREGGCGGLVAAAPPLRHDAALDHAAAQWASGFSIDAAAHISGYPAASLSGVHVSGPEASLVELLRRGSCHTVTDRSLRDLGMYHRGLDTWYVFASRSAGSTAVAPVIAQTPPKSVAPTPALSPPQALAARVLQLVNDVRARGARCGERAFGPAPPVRLSDTLNGVALGHAADMAHLGYFEHQDPAGHTPADRVRAVGYAEKLVGENIAYGPESADEVVAGWLGSPGHCENIMDPRFAEMGIASAVGHAERRGLYWVQLLVEPQV